jgi:hypothetical protein
MWPREGARQVPGLGGSAEGRARRWRSSGSRGNSGSGDRAARLDQQATRGAFVVHKEGLRSLGVRASTGGMFAPTAPMAERRGSRRVRVRARSGRGLAYMRAGGRLGVGGAMTVAHARVERLGHGRRRAPLRRPMACHGRCAGRWINATWRDPLATDGTGELPPAQRSDRRSLWRLRVRARRGYGAYGGLPTWPRTTSRQSASRRSRAFSIR